MSYFVDCPCGRRIDVVASQAGSSIACSCGAGLDVPTLTQLKRSAGEDHLSALDRIEQMLREGQLPPSDLCAYSGMPTKEIMFVAIECERAWIRGQEGDSLKVASMLLGAVFGQLAHLFHLARADGDERTLGRATGVSVPLRIAREFEKDVRKCSQRELKRLLRTVQIYGRLLDDYPEATVRAMPPRE